MEIDKPEAIAEARAVFDRHEAAIAADDEAALDAAFWPDPRTVRFGIAETRHGIEAIRASVRAYAPPITCTARLTAFGRDVACTHLACERVGTGLIGRETRIMARLPGHGWRVVAARVSRLAASDPGAVQGG